MGSSSRTHFPTAEPGIASVITFKQRDPGKNGIEAGHKNDL